MSHAKPSTRVLTAFENSMVEAIQVTVLYIKLIAYVGRFMIYKLDLYVDLFPSHKGDMKDPDVRILIMTHGHLH